MKPPSARLLDDLGVEYRLIRLRGRAVTTQDVIDRAEGELNPTEICKTIIVKDRGGVKHAVLLRGSDRIDFSKLKTVLGKVSVANRYEVVSTTGVEPGAVCPLTLKIHVYVDEGVMELKRINFGSGDHMYGIEIQTADLVKALSYTVMDLAEQCHRGCRLSRLASF
jgi:prolyl-tRNA editing enzyme YbaK/EbsC (Cys-tRNA(Pro) deacylase)